MGSSLYLEWVCPRCPGWRARPLPARDHLGRTRNPSGTHSGCVCGDIHSPLNWARKVIRIRRHHDSVQAWKCTFLLIFVS